MKGSVCWSVKSLQVSYYEMDAKCTLLTGALRKRGRARLHDLSTGIAPGLGAYTAGPDCVQERSVIAFGLIRIGLGERSNRPVERIL